MPRRGQVVRGSGQSPSSFLARLTSALASSVVPDMRRVIFEGFFSRLWRRPAFWRRILPEPVTRKRLEAPEWVLFLGMGVVSFFSLRVDLGVEVLGASALLLRRG